MTEEELKDLDREVKKLKRLASESAAQLHDLVEDRPPGRGAEGLINARKTKTSTRTR